MVDIQLLEDYKHVHGMAEAIIRHCKLTIPIDINSLLEQIGGKYSFSSDLRINEYAKIYPLPGDQKFEIVLNKKYEGSPSLNLRIAEQIGNLTLYMGYFSKDDRWNNIYDQGNPFISGPWQSSHDLRLSEEFGRCLMLPKQQFLDLLKSTEKDGYYYIDKIAEITGLTVDTIETRFEILNFMLRY